MYLFTDTIVSYFFHLKIFYMRRVKNDKYSTKNHYIWRIF